jgi:hypothetical protein
LGEFELWRNWKRHWTVSCHKISTQPMLKYSPHLSRLVYILKYDVHILKKIGFSKIRSCCTFCSVPCLCIYLYISVLSIIFSWWYWGLNLHLLGKSSTTWAMSPTLFYFTFQTGFHIFDQGQPGLWAS